MNDSKHTTLIIYPNSLDLSTKKSLSSFYNVIIAYRNNKKYLTPLTFSIIHLKGNHFANDQMLKFLAFTEIHNIAINEQNK